MKFVIWHWCTVRIYFATLNKSPEQIKEREHETNKYSIYLIIWRNRGRNTCFEAQLYILGTSKLYNYIHNESPFLCDDCIYFLI